MILHLRRGKRRETNRQNGNNAGKEGQRWECCWLFVLRTDVAVGGSRWSNDPEHIDNTGDQPSAPWGQSQVDEQLRHQGRIPVHIKTTSTSDTKANKDPSNNKTSKPKNSTVIFIMRDKWTRCYNICLNVTGFCSYVQDLLLRKEEVGHQFHNAFNMDWCVQARQQQELSRVNTEHNSFGRNLWNVKQISHYKHSRIYTHILSRIFGFKKNKL